MQGLLFFSFLPASFFFSRKYNANLIYCCEKFPYFSFKALTRTLSHYILQHHLKGLIKVPIYKLQYYYCGTSLSSEIVDTENLHVVSTSSNINDQFRGGRGGEG